MDFNWAMEQCIDGKRVTREDDECKYFISLAQGVLYKYFRNRGLEHQKYYADSKDIFANDWKIYDPHNSLHEFDNALKNLQSAADDFVKALDRIGKKILNHA